MLIRFFGLMILGFFISFTYPVLAEVTCDRTEKVGCIEFDVLNLKWQDNNVHMVGLNRPYTTERERYRRVTAAGPALYRAFKSGQVQPARERTFTVYMWNVNETATSRMSAYRFSNSRMLTRSTVTEVFATGGPAFDPAFSLGAPHRVFRVTADAGAALQVPWSMIGPNTYILICSGDSDGIYPNRQGSKKGGLWITPEYLASARSKGWEYMILPFLSRK